MKNLIFPFLILMLISVLLSCKKDEEKVNTAPSIEDQEFTIDENSPEDTRVGVIEADDKENAESITYSILSGNTDDAFSLDETSGVLTVNNKSAMDFESNSQFMLSVEVTDDAELSSTASVTVKLNDLQIPTDKMVLYYDFNNNLEDRSPEQNNGIDSTGGEYVTGYRDSALDFNGFSDFVTLSKNLVSGEGLSFSFWIKSRGAHGEENNGAIISKYNHATDERCFYIGSFGYYESRDINRLGIVFYKYGSSYSVHDFTRSYFEDMSIINNNSSELWNINSPAQLPKNEWVHCVVNCTETTLEIWLNNVLTTSKTREHSKYFDSSEEPVYIGNMFNSGAGHNNHFNGALDELRIYNRGLTTAEIEILYKE